MPVHTGASRPDLWFPVFYFRLSIVYSLLRRYLWQSSKGLFDLVRWIFVVGEAPGEVFLISRQVKMPVAGQIEQDGLCLAGLLAGQRLINGYLNAIAGVLGP